MIVERLELIDFRNYAVDVEHPGTTTSEATRVLGGFLRDVITRNPDNFRLFGPDETASNRLGDVFEVTNRGWVAETLPTDESLAPEGRVLEVLSDRGEAADGIRAWTVLTGHTLLRIEIDESSGRNRYFVRKKNTTS